MRFMPICIFGEVLLEGLPDGRRIPGGAPFNVAWHLSAFGEMPYLRSAVGDDPDGQLIRDAMADWGMELGGLQTDPHHPTGRIELARDGGELLERLPPDRAYDHIRQLRGGLSCDLLYHGTLALRAPASAEALDAIKARSPKQIFVDVNLRAPWWSREQTAALLAHADWAKLNAAELAQLMGLERPPGESDLAACAEDFRIRHGLRGLVVTLGARGAIAVCEREPLARVAPTATPRPPTARPRARSGAGDAFAAVMILGILRHWPLATALERAWQFASCIVRQAEATAADPGLYEPLIDEWDLAPRLRTAVPPPSVRNDTPARRGRGRPRRV